MAGGMLIAIMIISTAIYVYDSARGVAEQSDKGITANSVNSFNRFYVSYGSTIRGIDAVNICNKLRDDNEKRKKIGDPYPQIVNGGSDFSSLDISNYGSYYHYKYEIDPHTGYVSKITIR